MSERTLLLIEDDSATAQSIELMLNSERFNVYTTNLGEEGIDLGKLEAHAAVKGKFIEAVEAAGRGAPEGQAKVAIPSGGLLGDDGPGEGPETFNFTLLVSKNLGLQQITEPQWQSEVT